MHLLHVGSHIFSTTIHILSSSLSLSLKKKKKKNLGWSYNKKEVKIHWSRNLNARKQHKKWNTFVTGNSQKYHNLSDEIGSILNSTVMIKSWILFERKSTYTE